jgi:hypothetical protein
VTGCRRRLERSGEQVGAGQTAVGRPDTRSSCVVLQQHRRGVQAGISAPVTAPAVVIHGNAGDRGYGEAFGNRPQYRGVEGTWNRGDTERRRVWRAGQEPAAWIGPAPQ